MPRRALRGAIAIGAGAGMAMPGLGARVAGERHHRCGLGQHVPAGGGFDRLDDAVHLTALGDYPGVDGEPGREAAQHTEAQ